MEVNKHMVLLLLIVFLAILVVGYSIIKRKEKKEVTSEEVTPEHVEHAAKQLHATTQNIINTEAEIDRMTGETFKYIARIKKNEETLAKVYKRATKQAKRKRRPSRRRRR